MRLSIGLNFEKRIPEHYDQHSTTRDRDIVLFESINFLDNDFVISNLRLQRKRFKLHRFLRLQAVTPVSQLQHNCKSPSY
jgi:hypothetical protein